MATLARGLHRYTYADYIAIELASPDKYEFIDGEIYLMAGGGEEHSALTIQAAVALNRAVGDRPCRVHGSDLRIYVEEWGVALYPDGSVICGGVQQHEPSPDATALNPIVLVEVTSDSSAHYDLGVKFDFYKTIPSLRDIVVISHRERRVAVYSRGERLGDWHPRVALAGERVQVRSLEADLIVDDIYRGSSIR